MKLKCWVGLFLVFMHAGKLYAIGGHDGDEHLNTCEVFDPVTNRWKCIAPMKTLRYWIVCGDGD